MIWAAIKMGWSDKRLLLPSVLSVFSQTFFFVLLIVLTYGKVPHTAQPPSLVGHSQSAPVAGMPTFGLLKGDHPQMKVPRSSLDAEAAKEKMQQMLQMMRPNGEGDPNGFDAEGGGFGAIFNGDNALLLAGIASISWLINRILEGVTTALVYSHLTEGKGTGRFSQAFKAVFLSLPAIVMLGIVTWLARRMATLFKKSRPGGMFGMMLGFVFGFVEIFWTLAGHLILPAVVIEGCSFWGGLKRADKIAQGNLLTMGIGEIGVEGICRLANALVLATGFLAVGGAVYAFMQYHILINPVVALAAAIAWVCALVIACAASAYIKAAFYTCLYVWAIEAESVEAVERPRVKPPAPLALALSAT
jgi:hypothetical protein